MSQRLRGTAYNNHAAGSLRTDLVRGHAGGGFNTRNGRSWISYRVKA